MVGSVARNTAADNGRNGINVSFFERLTGDIVENTAERNGRRGIVALVNDLDGNIQKNTANDNDLGGIAFTGELDGNVKDNTASDNDREGFNFGNVMGGGFSDPNRRSIVGDISGNTANNNGLAGMKFTLQSLNANLTSNTAGSNTGLGMEIELKGDTASALQILNNAFSENNTGNTESKLENSGSTTLNLTLQNNTSLNSSSGLDDPNNPPFNYDLLNTGGGTFNVSPANVNGLNTGTVGSSDGSVVIP